MKRRRQRGPWLWPLGILLLGTVLFRFTHLDLALAESARGADATWTSSETGLWGFLYRVAPYPGILLGLGSLLHLLASWRWKWFRRRNRVAWFFLAVLAIGPGLIVNTLLKDHFGRPRPRQVEVFGGDYPFLPVLTPGPHRDARSFPSGHASIAFYLLTPWFCLRSQRRLANAFLWGGLAWGLLIGLTRVLQGGHWPSDVLWAAGIVYFTGYLLSGAFDFRRGKARVTAFPY